MRLPPVLLVALYMLMAPAMSDDGLKERIEDDHAKGADHWIYNDIAAGFEEARRTEKPLFITFRCVPCQDCMGFDGEVASGSERVKQLAAERFVCVRQVEMKGVDLSLFQFDHDLNWAGMFLNADGTIYARYGTQSDKGADAYNSVAGLVNTMQRVLELHAGYPQNKAGLVGKRAEPKSWKTATDIPTLSPNLRKAGQTTRSNCIHCHNIHDAENDLWTSQGTMSHDRLWRYPLPENIGLTIDPTDGRTVTSVAHGSFAEKSRIATGSKLETMNGQTISSIADIQWVLHHIPNQDGQRIKLSFANGSMADIRLRRGWKKTDISWRGSLWSLSPRLRVWMPPLNSFQREEAGLNDETGALLVKWINRNQPGGDAAARAGLRQGDIVLKFDGNSVPRTPQKFSEMVKLNYKVGQTIPVTVLRDGKEIVIDWPLVE